MFGRKKKDQPVSPSPLTVVPQPPVPEQAPPRSPTSLLTKLPVLDDLDIPLPGEEPRAPTRTMPTLTPLPRKRPQRIPHKTAPLFIKVDRYQDVLDTIDGLKAQSVHLRDVVDAMHELQRQLGSGMDAIGKVIDNFSEILTGLDASLARVDESHSPDDLPPAHDDDIEHYVKQVYDQVEKVDQQLKPMKKR